MFNIDEFKAMGATLVRVTLAAMLGQIIAFGNGVLDFTGEQWRMVLAAGLAAIIVTLVQWVNPGNEKYGRGYIPPDGTGNGDQGDGQ